MSSIVGRVTAHAAAERPYGAYLSQGNFVGNFVSARAAQQAIQLQVGLARRLRWERDDLTGGIESYVGIDTVFSPDDLDACLTYLDANRGVVVVDTTTQAVPVWKDFSGLANNQRQPSLPLQPVLDASVPGLEYGVSGADQLSLAPVVVAPPFTVNLVAVAPVPDLDFQIALELTPSAGAIFRIGSGAGVTRWVVDNGAAMLGPVMVAAETHQVTVLQSATGAEFFFDGVSVATNLSVPAQGEFLQLGAVTGAGLRRWEGLILSAAVYGRLLPLRERQQLEAFQAARYGSPAPP